MTAAASDVAWNVGGVRHDHLMPHIADVLSRSPSLPACGMGTGFDRLDELTGGFEAGRVWLVTGAPGQGRSTIMAQWAGQFAATYGWATWLVAPRESEAATVARLLASLGGLPLNHLWDGRYERLDEERLLATKDLLAGSQLWILAGERLHVPRLVDDAPIPRAMIFDDGDLVDGLSAEAASRLADDGACVIVSLPRHLLVEGPGRWSDLDPLWARVADAIVEVRWNGLPEERLGEAELWLLKNRRGPLTVASVAFQGHYARFVDLRDEWGNEMAADSKDLSASVLQELGPTEEWATPGGYPDSLALCVIDAIQSIGQQYGGVRHVVHRYREHRAAQDGDADTDGAVELAATFADLGSVEIWAGTIGTHNRVYARADAPLKAEVIRDAAKVLVQQGVLTTGDLLGLSDERRESLKRAWLGLKSQRSGISWRYLLMLAGAEGVKPDRMITRFLARHVPGAGQLDSNEAVDLVSGVAHELGVSANTLDHRIWLYERIREADEVTDRTASGENNGKTMASEEGQTP